MIISPALTVDQKACLVSLFTVFVFGREVVVKHYFLSVLMILAGSSCLLEEYEKGNQAFQLLSAHLGSLYNSQQALQKLYL